MKFLVYSVEPLEENATLDGFGEGVDPELARIDICLRDMTLERVFENDSVNLLVNDVQYERDAGIITGDIYKHANPGSALHQFERSEGEITIQEILSEKEEAFKKGVFGMKKIDGEVVGLIQKKFGSYFSAASKGFHLNPHYSAEAIKSIQNSGTIGKTELDFNDESDVTASLFRPPEDADIREDDGFGNTDVLNKLMSVMRISRSHRITLDISREEWMEHVELFEQLIQLNAVSTVRVKGTKDNTVKIGQGRDRSIRETVQTVNTGEDGVGEAFGKLSQ
jgi:hypothetical protein